MTLADRPAAAARGRSIIKAIADNSSAGSLATSMRRRRFALFLALLRRLDRPVSVLDIGGTQQFWELMGDEALGDVSVTLLNVMPQPVSSPRFRSVTGDARAMPEFADRSFDVVFSNSVIEHLGPFEEQARMAAEVRRIGRHYFVQTPNKRFPLEPHFLFPWFQYLPLSLRVWLVSHFDVGWYQRIPDPRAARAEVESIQLLTTRRFRELFPDAKLYREKLGPVTKSFVAYHGWDS